MKRLLSALALLASPAAASDYCHELWYTRNAIMHQAGYCFGSVLGQAVFGTGPCIGKSVTLSPEDNQTVARLRAAEKELSCRVNTKQPHLELDDLFVRRQLWDVPIPDEAESACIGWMGPEVILHAGQGADTPVVGSILPGQTVSYGHWPGAGWTYVTVSPGQGDWRTISGGWMNYERIGEVPCQQYAG